MNLRTSVYNVIEFLSYLPPNVQHKRVDDYQCEKTLRYQSDEDVHTEYQAVTIFTYILGDLKATKNTTAQCPNVIILQSP